MEGKGIYYFNSGNRYDGDLKNMIKKKEKEQFIFIMVIDMKVSLKMINIKERGLCIIIMAIEKWAIISMEHQWENMLNLIFMEKLNRELLIRIKI